MRGIKNKKYGVNNMREQLMKIQKENFNIESEEFAAMFLLISQGCYYPNELNDIDHNVINVFKDNNVNVQIGSGFNKKYMISVI